MKTVKIYAGLAAAALLLVQPAFAQTTPDNTKTSTQKPHKQRTDGDGPPMIGPASGAYKQRTDGDGPTMVGPASGAYKQRTQSLSHSDGSPAGVVKQN